jgi:hypothetical protein
MAFCRSSGACEWLKDVIAGGTEWRLLDLVDVGDVLLDGRPRGHRRRGHLALPSGSGRSREQKMNTEYDEPERLAWTWDGVTKLKITRAEWLRTMCLDFATGRFDRIAKILRWQEAPVRMQIPANEPDPSPVGWVEVPTWSAASAYRVATEGPIRVPMVSSASQLHRVLQGRKSL